MTKDSFKNLYKNDKGKIEKWTKRMLNPSHAAKYIRNGVEKNSPLILFPTYQYILIKLMSLIPFQFENYYYFPLGRHARKEHAKNLFWIEQLEKKKVNISKKKD